VPYRCEPVAEVEGTPRGIEISAVAERGDLFWL